MRDARRAVDRRAGAVPNRPRHSPRGLPVDADVDVDETTRGRPRPIHLHPGYIALVAAGGAAGTAAREGVVLAVPAIGDVPVPILIVNVVGAFLLGLLLDALVRLGEDRGTRRIIRLLLGTGFMGGFTTYSALATDTALLTGGSGALGAGYALATVVLGGCATWAGIALAPLATRKAAQ